MVDVCNQSNCIIKILFQKWKVCKKKNLSWVWGTDRKICPWGSHSDIIQQASLPDSNPRDGFFYLPPTPKIDSYITWVPLLLKIIKLQLKFIFQTMDFCLLIHFSLGTPKIVTGKQCRPRSDVAECGIWSGSTLFALTTGISIKYSNNNK